MAITIVGLGPGFGGHVTREAWEVLTASDRVYLRTSRHPTVAELPASLTVINFDHLYETADSFADVYRAIAARLIRESQAADIVYAVPGHPLVGEATVTQLLSLAQDNRIEIKIVDGLSFIEPTLTAIGADGLDGLQVHDAIEVAGLQYPPVNPDAPLLLAQVYSQLLASELKIVLMTIYPDEHEVWLVHGAGTRDEVVEELPLYAIDHSRRIGHLTSLYVPRLAGALSLAALANTVAVLRSPEGCPWDQEQTPQSMRGGLQEEVAEVLAALDAADPLAVREELGDVLYHLVMQAQMAAEAGDFNLTDVIVGIETKLKRRHPHVWGDWKVADSAEVIRNWELIKQKEKAKTAQSLLDAVPNTLPALARSQKIQQRVKSVGFDWDEVSDVWSKLSEELDELKKAVSPSSRTAELGDLLFAVVNLARWLEIDAETALREANLRFDQRFRLVEDLVAARGLVWAQLSLAALDSLWEEAKEQLAKADAPAKVE